MKRLARALIAAVGFTLLSGTAHSQVKHVDMAIYEVDSAIGKGGTTDEAFAAAQGAAIDQAALAVFLQTDSELGRYRSVRERLIARKMEFLKSSRMIDKYVEDGLGVVEIAAVVYRAKLGAALDELGVLTRLEAEQTPRPRVLCYVGDGARDELSRFAVGRVNERLTQHQVETIDRATIERLVAEDADIAASPSGVRRLALRSQASVYLLVSVRVERTRSFGRHNLYQATVRIEAWDPAAPEAFEASDFKSRELTFEHGEDIQKARLSAVEEAIGGAMEPVSRAVFKVWKDAAEKGSAYRIVLGSRGARARERLADELRALCSTVTAEANGEAAAFIVRYPGVLEDLVEKLVARLERPIGLTVREEGMTEALLEAR